MRELVHRMGRITSQLRGFARKSSPEEQSVDPEVCIANAQALLEAVWKRQDVQIRVDRDGMPAGVPLRVRFESIRLEQVLVNLLSNAFDAAHGRPDPRILVTVRRVTVRDEERVHIVVDDNGPGVPESARAKLFDPFFTTKQPGKGLGLGLAISRSLAADFNAHLTFEERAPDTHDTDMPSCGSRFVLDLQGTVAS
jgi:two-component system C4-dicarboxylate transport sensor histidine kinase DctB